MILRCLLLFAGLFLAVQPSYAQSTLEVDTVTSCDDAQGVVLKHFDLRYYKNNETIFVDIQGLSYIGGFNGTAHLNVFAAGVSILSRDVSLCTINVSQVCPFPAGPFQVTTSIPAPPQIQTQIPSFVFNLPQIATSVKLSVTKDAKPDQPVQPSSGKSDMCVIAEFGNGKSLRVPGIAWTSSGFAFAAVLLGGLRLLNAIGSGDIDAALAPGFPSLAHIVFYSQHIAYLGQLNLEFPKFYLDFTLNFAWATGLIRFQFAEDAINAARKQFGGYVSQWPLTIPKQFSFSGAHQIQYSPVTRALVNVTGNHTNPVPGNLTNPVPGNLTNPFPGNLTNNLPGNITSKMPDLTNSTLTDTNISAAINSTYVVTPQNVSIDGLEAYAKELQIPSANVFMTVLIVFLLVLLLLTIVMMIGYILLHAMSKTTSNKESKLKKITSKYPHLYTGYSLQLIMMAYSCLLTYALFQFTVRDSWITLLCAALTVSIIGLLLGWTSLQILRADREALYVDKHYTYRYGFIYKSYRKEMYTYFAPVVIYTVAKACLVGLAQENAWVQAIGNLAAEGFLFLVMLLLRPFRTAKENIFSLIVQFFQTVAALLAFFFLGPLETDVERKTMLGIVMLGIQSLISLFLYIVMILALISAVRELIKKKRGKGKKEKKNEDDSEKAEGNQKEHPEDAEHAEHAEHAKQDSTVEHNSISPTERDSLGTGPAAIKSPPQHNSMLPTRRDSLGTGPAAIKSPPQHNSMLPTRRDSLGTDPTAVGSAPRYNSMLPTRRDSHGTDPSARRNIQHSSLQATRPLNSQTKSPGHHRSESADTSLQDSAVTNPAVRRNVQHSSLQATRPLNSQPKAPGHHRSESADTSLQGGAVTNPAVRRNVQHSSLQATRPLNSRQKAPEQSPSESAGDASDEVLTPEDEHPQK